MRREREVCEGALLSAGPPQPSDPVKYCQSNLASSSLSPLQSLSLSLSLSVSLSLSFCRSLSDCAVSVSICLPLSLGRPLSLILLQSHSLTLSVSGCLYAVYIPYLPLFFLVYKCAISPSSVVVPQSLSVPGDSVERAETGGHAACCVVTLKPPGLFSPPSTIVASPQSSLHTAP